MARIIIVTRVYNTYLHIHVCCSGTSNYTYVYIYTQWDFFYCYSLSIEDPLVSNDTIYQFDKTVYLARWTYNDTELNDPTLVDNIEANWIVVGTHPLADDVQNVSYEEVSMEGEMSLSVGDVTPILEGDLCYS